MSIQYELFDAVACEVREGAVRYIFRRNPIRAQELQENREEKQQSVDHLIKKQNEYLQSHQKAKTATALKHVEKKIKSLKIDSWLSVKATDRTLTLSVDADVLAEEQMLDGCYVIKTDLSRTEYDTQTIHDRYKDLALVESAFRTCKTTLELRPIHVRKKNSTHAHVLVVMLAYMIIRHLDQKWASLYLTVEEGLRSLSTLSLQEVTMKGHASFQQIPEPRKQNKAMLEMLDIELPRVLSKSSAHVVTRKNRRIASTSF